eukprot:COSAG02_NODE_1065_length_14831_cov_34.330981_2_plen_443_part_00
MSDSADAQRLRFVQRELADLKAEISLIRQAAQAAPGAGATLALAAAPEHPAEVARTSPARRPLPPPPPPPPAQPSGSAPAVSSTPTSDVVPAISNTPADMDGKCDLMAAIRAAGGSLRKAALKTSQMPEDGSTDATPAKLNDGRPNMRSIVPSTPPTLRKVAEHSPGGTPMGTPRALILMFHLHTLLSPLYLTAQSSPLTCRCFRAGSSSTDASKSQIQDFLGSALRERSKRIRGISPASDDSEGVGPMRTDSDNSAWAPSPRTSPEMPPRINVDAEISIGGQTKRKRQCSFTGIDRRNTPLSMSSPSKAKPAPLPRCATNIICLPLTTTLSRLIRQMYGAFPGLRIQSNHNHRSTAAAPPGKSVRQQELLKRRELHCKRECALPLAHNRWLTLHSPPCLKDRRQRQQPNPNLVRYAFCIVHCSHSCVPVRLTDTRVASTDN